MTARAAAVGTFLIWPGELRRRSQTPAQRPLLSRLHLIRSQTRSRSRQHLTRSRRSLTTTMMTSMTMMTTTTMTRIETMTGTTRKGEAMTTDALLVERLRDIRMSGATLRRVAANRIEALNKENEILLGEVEYLKMMRDDLQKGFDNAADTRDRLREALEQLACKCSSNCDWLHDDICPSWIARAALRGHDDD
jgi:hypothetical protein